MNFERLKISVTINQKLEIWRTIQLRVRGKFKTKIVFSGAFHAPYLQQKTNA